MASISKLKYYIAIILVLLGCHSHEIIQDTNQIFPGPPISDSLSFYFPSILNEDSSFRKNPMYVNFAQNWYSSALYSFKEPVLRNKKGTEIMYRLLWLRSFHQPVCFTLKKFENQYYLSIKMLDRQPAWYPSIEGNYINGKEVLDTIHKADRKANIIFNQTISIDKAEWNKFESFLVSNNFWQLPSIDKSDDSTDGSNLVLEGCKENKYHFIERRNGQNNLRESAKYLLKLGNLKLSEDEIY